MVSSRKNSARGNNRRTKIKYFTDVSRSDLTVCLSLHCNYDHSYLNEHWEEIVKFKTK